MAISTLALAALLASAQLVSIDNKDMELRDFFRVVATATNMNVSIDPAVQGKVNLLAKDAPLEEVLAAVLTTHGLERRVEGNTMQIVPAPDDAQFGTYIRVLSYAKAEDVAAVISKLISPRGTVIAYTPLNAVIVRDVVPGPQSPR